MHELIFINYILRHSFTNHEKFINIKKKIYLNHEIIILTGAREVRRLIREASFDSLASEFSLDVSLNDGVGGQTAAQFDSLCEEIYNLKDNCDIMSEKIDFNNISSANENSVKMKSSKSDFFREINNSKESTPDLSAGGASAGNDVGNSSPDLRNLHKIIHSAPARNKRMWTLTHNTGFSDNESTYSPIHRDSSASPIFHDNTRDSRYKIALSSNTSECGDWEWDSEGLGNYLFIYLLIMQKKIVKSIFTKKINK